MSKLLLDSGPIIRLFRGQKRVAQLIRSLGNESRLSISAITRIELHAGMLSKDRFATQKLLSRFLTHNVDREIADRAGDIMSALRQNGRTASMPDAIIAATAIANNITLVTFNKAHFEIISGLSLYPLSDEY